MARLHMSGYDALIASARVFAVRIQINQINKENRLMMARAAIMPFEWRNKRDEFQWQQCGDVRARARTLAKHISKTQQLNTTQFYGIRYVSSLSHVQRSCALPFSRQIHIRTNFVLLFTCLSSSFSLRLSVSPRFSRHTLLFRDF